MGTAIDKTSAEQFLPKEENRYCLSNTSLAL